MAGVTGQSCRSCSEEQAPVSGRGTGSPKTWAWKLTIPQAGPSESLAPAYPPPPHWAKCGELHPNSRATETTR